MRSHSRVQSFLMKRHRSLVFQNVGNSRTCLLLLLPLLSHFLLLVAPVTSLSIPSPSSSSSLPPCIQYRSGTSADSLPIAWQLGRELMNPLGVQGKRFIVASSSSTTNNNNNINRIGWAQIRPLPNRQRAIEEETDDVMWDEFEADTTIQVPVGWQSLPWTKEYREFAAASAKARQRPRTAVQEEVQKETPILYELASVWVDPAFRGQGIGTELVRRVLQRHVDEMEEPLENVYLLTLASTANWYTQKFGFHQIPIEYVPTQMAFEVQAGNAITSVIGAELVCMQGDSKAFQAGSSKKRS